MISSDEIKKRLKARREGKSYKQEAKGYLICDICSGYYELQKGESPDDFVSECDCGGNLIYSNSLEVANSDNNYKNALTCPTCGTPNPDYANFCQECGKKII